MGYININKERLISLFCRLVEIDSESFNERAMADFLKNQLKELGFEVKEDKSSSLTGSNAGNIYAFLKGNIPEEPVLLSGHMDTVCPGNKKKALIHEDGKITSSGDSVLGADDINALCCILEAIKSVKEAGLARRDIEIVFSVCEEPYCEGIKVFDFCNLKSESAFIFDMSGKPGLAACAAPSIISFEAEITGKSAHAGFDPESGINAIKIMAEAISELKQGHTDDDTTFNIGLIDGGLLTNIVPEKCRCSGEIRSLSHKKALEAAENAKSVFETAARENNAQCRFKTKVHIRAYETPEESRCVKIFAAACENLNLPGKLITTYGGSDNNVFAQHGIEGIVLSCGMHNVHSKEEYTYIDELVLCADLAAELITVRNPGK